jgi:hypothetical protein
MQNTSHAVMAQRTEPKDSPDDFPTPPWATRALIEHIFDARMDCQSIPGYHTPIVAIARHPLSRAFVAREDVWQRETACFGLS